MTLGEFRQRTEHLDDETEFLVCSSYDFDSGGVNMGVSDLEEIDFYDDEDVKLPILVVLFNDEE